MTKQAVEEEEAILTQKELQAQRDARKRNTVFVSLTCFLWVVVLLVRWDARRPAASPPPRPLAAIAKRLGAEAYEKPANLTYAEWPAPQTARSLLTMIALGLGNRMPLVLDAAQVARDMLALAQSRGASGPAILVIAGGSKDFGLGNTFSGLAAAAVTAEAIGAACLVTLGETYARQLLKHVAADRYFASPCKLVEVAELEALRAQRAVPVVRHERWRIAGLWNATGDGTRPATGAFLIDLGTQYRELGCMPRHDTAKLLAPPGMAAREFWARLRRVFEAWVRAAVALPVEPHELLIDSARPWASGGSHDGSRGALRARRAAGASTAGTICGHMRMLHLEAHRFKDRAEGAKLPTCAEHDCGGVLGAMEAVHSARPFRSFFYASGANCTPCLAESAPTLSRRAARISSGHLSRHMVERLTFDNAEGAFADMRALSRCAVLLVDDKAEGTFALSVAAAGRLTPCAHPLLGPGASAARAAGSLSLERFGHVRALCATSNLGAPVTPPPWPLAPADLASLEDAVRFDVTRPWDPVHLPPPGQPAAADGTPYVPPGCTLHPLKWRAAG